MSTVTRQMKYWEGDFGNTYIERNRLTPAGLDKMYKESYGITAEKLNSLFVGKFSRDIRILEVGSNIGNQLLLLQKMEFKNLYGIEINGRAVELAKHRTKGINIIQGSAFDIPFKDGYFDLVFTAGVLIHIHPKDIGRAMNEIYRSSRKYIKGFEYYSEKYEQVVYRGNRDMLWKADFPKIYTDKCPGCKIVKSKFVKYRQNENMDVMFLLKKC
jgi:pseudaminic acid biosynthesis-associated methylase